jgi:hypothetical protein
VLRLTALRLCARARNAAWLGIVLGCFACTANDAAPDHDPLDGGAAHDGGLTAEAHAEDAELSSDAASGADAGPSSSARDASVALDSGPAALDAGRDAAPATSDAAAAACASPAVCSDFEADKPGALAGAWSARSPNCSGDGKATIDDSVAHSGKKSLRVQSGGGTCNHVFATPTLDFNALGAAFWLRFYVRFESALSDAHVTFLALQDQVSKKALRMGGQKKILIWNRELDDATLPELSPNGIGLSVAPEPGSFQCVEFHLDGAEGTLETYLDGKRVEGLVIDGTGTQDIDGQWLRSGKWTAKVSEIGFGWESYGGEPMLLWFDDVAISAQRAGCSP